MPVGKVDNFFPITLKSIESQTYKDFEFILICNDLYFLEIKSIISKYNFFHKPILIKTKLKGVAFAANLGLSFSKGKYIARWDADDLCDKNRFAMQIKELDHNPQLAVIGTRVEIIDEKGRKDLIHKFKFYGDNKSIRTALKYRQPFLHSSLMFRSDILFFNKGYLYGHTSEDHELFIRIARNQKAQFKNLPNVITYYRRHPSQLSDLSNQKNHFYEISAFMYSEFLRTWNFLYLVGMFANLPLLRKWRHFYRRILALIFKQYA